MLVDLTKFIHLLITLSLLGLTFYCVTTKDAIALRKINLMLLVLSVFAVLTGTLLVYPKHFTFHTPWIVAAFILVGVFFVFIAALFFIRKKNTAQTVWLRGIYVILLLLLIFVIHDAVMKTTLLFRYHG